MSPSKSVAECVHDPAKECVNPLKSPTRSLKVCQSPSKSLEESVEHKSSSEAMVEAVVEIEAQMSMQRNLPVLDAV